MDATVSPVLSILGYILGAAAGIAAIGVGAMGPEPGFIVIGVAFIAAVVVAFIAGASAKPTGSIPKREFGGKFEPHDWAWHLAAGIIVVGCVVGGIMLAL